MQINPDTTKVVNLSIVRSGGTFGIVSIQWMLSSNDSFVTLPTDIAPTFGLVVFNDGQNITTVSFTIQQDDLPRPVRLLRVDLLAATVTGGAQADGVLSAYLVIEDTNMAYGSVQISSSQLASVVSYR